MIHPPLFDHHKVITTLRSDLRGFVIQQLNLILRRTCRYARTIPCTRLDRYTTYWILIGMILDSVVLLNQQLQVLTRDRNPLLMRQFHTTTRHGSRLPTILFDSLSLFILCIYFMILRPQNIWTLLWINNFCRNQWQNSFIRHNSSSLCIHNVLHIRRHGN